MSNELRLRVEEYAEKAAATAVYNGRMSREGLVYAALGLAGEAGELANQAKKLIRGDDDVFHSGDRGLILQAGDASTPSAMTSWTISESRREKMNDELGDVLWYVATMAAELHIPLLSEIAERNLDKLAGRAAAGTLKGDGNTR